MSNFSRMKVLFMASEADPLIKVGGLGDVAGSLPRAIKALTRSGDSTSLELDIRLVIPFHPSILSDVYNPLQVAEYPIQSKDGEIVAKAFSIDIDGLPVYLLGGPPIDQETAVYSLDLEADGYKYVFFSLATLELARKLNWQPDVLHANDWHTASAVYSLGLHRFSDPFFGHTTALITVHNLPYLGAMTATAMDAFGLPAADHSELPAWAQHMALPLGLLAADSIVAVSPEYAKEILTENFGSGLHIFLRAHREKITGILNGLDTYRWNPASDAELTANYSIGNLPSRSANKILLQQELGLEINPRIPLIAMVTRMDPQKGVDLAVAALRLLLPPANTNGSRFHAVFLGIGNPVLESSVRQLEEDYPDQIRARIMYNERLSRHIYAGADVLLLPSRYEPCGLSQMIAMRYGCVPVAHATGGLSDTIEDASASNQGTGFLFKNTDPSELTDAIQRALTVYMHDPQGWQKIQIRGMQQDFSWARSAQEYLQQYRKLSGIKYV
jgi:starch synthase